jgi:hypothetical protein
VPTFAIKKGGHLTLRVTVVVKGHKRTAVVPLVV